MQLKMDGGEPKKPKERRTTKKDGKKAVRNLLGTEYFVATNRPPASGRQPLSVTQMLRIVLMDHSYAMPTIPAEKKTNCFPVRFLFRSDDEILALNEASKPENGSTKKQASKRNQKSKSVEEQEVDVVSPDPDKKIPYDELKAIGFMKECEKNVNFARLYDVGEEWEDTIDKTTWTKVQKQLFSNVIGIFHEDHLARLAAEGNHAEPIHRRLAVNRSTNRMREALTQIGWNSKLVQWLHRVLVDNLSFSYLAAYLDILQTLRAKIPNLIDRMITSAVAVASVEAAVGGGELPNTCDTFNVEAVNLLLKRKWDPFSSSCHQSKLKKLNTSPIFLVVPSGPSNSNLYSQQRQKTLLSMLAGVGRLVFVTINSSVQKLDAGGYCETILSITKQKLTEVSSTYQEKQIYLFGWGIGAVVAATLALTEPVAGVICLGFPLYGLFGTRNDIDDTLLELKRPVLFVVGEDAANNSVTDMEIYRRGLSCINGLCVVSHADASLRVQNYHQKRMLVTQSYVDKCIVDEITWFLVNVPILKEDLRAQAEALAEEAAHVDRLKHSSNSSTSKRKSSIRNSFSRDSSAPNYITASKLVQQNNSKRKTSVSSTSADPVGDIKADNKPNSGIKVPSDLPESKVRRSSTAGSNSSVAIPTSFSESVSTGAPTEFKSGSLRITSELKSSDQTFTTGGVDTSAVGSSNLLRYQLSKAASIPSASSSLSGYTTKPCVLKKERVGSAHLNHSISNSIGTLDQNQSGKPGQPMMVHTLNADFYRRLSATNQAGLNDSTKQETVGSDPKHHVTQFVRQLPSLQATFQQMAGKPDGVTGESSVPSTHIIRVTPITVTHSASSTQFRSSMSSGGTSSGNVEYAGDDKPLPTRCTDESLSTIDSSEGFPRPIFQHLKSTLSGTREFKNTEGAPTVFSLLTSARQAGKVGTSSASSTGLTLSGAMKLHSFIDKSSTSPTIIKLTSSPGRQMESAAQNVVPSFQTPGTSQSASGISHDSSSPRAAATSVIRLVSSSTSSDSGLNVLSTPPPKNSEPTESKTPATSKKTPTQSKRPPKSIKDTPASSKSTPKATKKSPKPSEKTVKPRNTNPYKPGPKSKKLQAVAAAQLVSQSVALQLEKVAEAVQAEAANTKVSASTSTKEGKVQDNSKPPRAKKSKASTETTEDKGTDDGPPKKIRKVSSDEKKTVESKRKSSSDVDPSSKSPRSKKTSKPSTEVVEESCSDDGKPRLTRTRSKSSRQSTDGPSSSTGNSLITDQDPSQFTDQTSVEEPVECKISGDELDPDSAKRKKLVRPIHPVSPASLSASRTRKISIPKYYAFGM